MSEQCKKIKPRVKTVGEAVRLLKELTLKADVRIDDLETSLISLRIKLESPASTRFPTAKSPRQPTWAQANTDQCLDTLVALARKIQSEQ